MGGEVNACKEKMGVVKPSIWRSPKPTVASPKLKPASPRSWRTVCGLKCKDVTQDKGVHLVVRERAYSTVTEVEREQPKVVKPRTPIAPEARPQVPKKARSVERVQSKTATSLVLQAVIGIIPHWEISCWNLEIRCKNPIQAPQVCMVREEQNKKLPFQFPYLQEEIFLDNIRRVYSAYLKKYQSQYLSRAILNIIWLMSAALQDDI